jgi:hypothetical protein
VRTWHVAVVTEIDDAPDLAEGQARCLRGPDEAETVQ